MVSEKIRAGSLPAIVSAWGEVRKPVKLLKKETRMNFTISKRKSITQISQVSVLPFEGKPVLSRKQGNDLFVALRLPLWVGACLGLVPIRGLFSGKYCFTWIHIRTLITLLVSIGLYLQTIFIGHHFFVALIHGRISAGDLILIFSGVWFYLVGSMICTFFLVKSKHLCGYFDQWWKISCSISAYSETDKRIGRHVNLITTVLLLNCLGENILYHFHAMKEEVLNNLTFTRFLADYYESNQYIYPFFDYSLGSALILFVTNKIATFAWNFGDLLLILLSLALYGKYKCLNSYLENRMEIQGSIPSIRKGAVCWQRIRSDFFLITELLKDANRLLAPLIWISFITDIFFICRQLYEGLAPRPTQKTVKNKIYMVWSLLLIIGRSLGVNLMATLMSEEAHRMFKLTQYCRPDEYDVEVSRLERFLRDNVVGISGSGCFTITRSFLMQIISVIFTLEVVLLQNAHVTFG